MHSVLTQVLLSPLAFWLHLYFLVFGCKESLFLDFIVILLFSFGCLLCLCLLKLIHETHEDSNWTHIGMSLFLEKLEYFPIKSVVKFSQRPDIVEWKQRTDRLPLLSSVGFCPRRARLVCFFSNTAKAQPWQIVIYVWTLSLQPGLIQCGLSIPKGAFFPSTMMQVGHSCQSAARTKKKTCVTLMHFFVYVCLCTCRPPVLSQVLPRAHSASQGSVVAVHRMQDLQQLSGSRKECGEWRSEYGGLAAEQCLWTLSSLLKCQIEMLIDVSVVLGLSYFSQPLPDFSLFLYLSSKKSLVFKYS